MFFPQSTQWLAADSLRPTLHASDVALLRAVEIMTDEAAQGGCGAREGESIEALNAKFWRQGAAFTLDLGDHHVGYLSFDLGVEGKRSIANLSGSDRLSQTRLKLEWRRSLPLRFAKRLRQAKPL